jgi:hypothetical protein
MGSLRGFRMHGPSHRRCGFAGCAVTCHPDQQHELLPVIAVLSWDAVCGVLWTLVPALSFLISSPLSGAHLHSRVFQGTPLLLFW